MMTELTVEIVRLISKASGESMMTSKAAAIRAINELNNDFVVAILAQKNNQYAVKIGSLDPNVTDSQARWRWNVASAIGDRQSYVDKSDAWKELDAISGRCTGI